MKQAFNNEIKGFISKVTWTYAKTMPEWPHEYIVRGKVDENLFIKIVVISKFNFTSFSQK